MDCSNLVGLLSDAFVSAVTDCLSANAGASPMTCFQKALAGLTPSSSQADLVHTICTTCTSIPLAPSDLEVKCESAFIDGIDVPLPPGSTTHVNLGALFAVLSDDVAQALKTECVTSPQDCIPATFQTCAEKVLAEKGFPTNSATCFVNTILGGGSSTTGAGGSGSCIPTGAGGSGASGGASTTTTTTATSVSSASGTSSTSSSMQTCVNGDGLYCGGDGIMGDPNTLYSCVGGQVTVVQVCPMGCEWMPTGTNDACKTSCNAQSGQNCAMCPATDPSPGCQMDASTCQDCPTCCAYGNPDGETNLFNDFLTYCGCSGDGSCYAECSATCAGSPDPSCVTCLNASFSDPCGTTAIATCMSDPSCNALLDCWNNTCPHP